MAAVFAADYEGLPSARREAVGVVRSPAQRHQEADGKVTQQTGRLPLRRRGRRAPPPVALHCVVMWLCLCLAPFSVAVPRSFTASSLTSKQSTSFDVTGESVSRNRTAGDRDRPGCLLYPFEFSFPSQQMCGNVQFVAWIDTFMSFFSSHPLCQNVGLFSKIFPLLWQRGALCAMISSKINSKSPKLLNPLCLILSKTC